MRKNHSAVLCADRRIMENLPPPGFYPDPENPGEERWWNGQAWSEERRPIASGAQAIDTDRSEMRKAPNGEHSTDTMEWDTTLLPKSRAMRFLVLRPTWQIFAAVALVPILGTVLGVLLVNINLISLSWIAVAPLIGYPILFHGGLRRRYGFRGKEPGEKLGYAILDYSTAVSENERRNRKRQ